MKESIHFIHIFVLSDDGDV